MNETITRLLGSLQVILTPPPDKCSGILNIWHWAVNDGGGGGCATLLWWKQPSVTHLVFLSELTYSCSVLGASPMSACPGDAAEWCPEWPDRQGSDVVSPACRVSHQEKTWWAAAGGKPTSLVQAEVFPGKCHPLLEYKIGEFLLYVLFSCILCLFLLTIKWSLVCTGWSLIQYSACSNGSVNCPNHCREWPLILKWQKPVLKVHVQKYRSVDNELACEREVSEL